MTTPGVACALCAAGDPTQPYSLAVTNVGPLPCCGPHVDAALAKLGYAGPADTDAVTSFLEAVDPKELESTALELVGDFSEGTTTFGQAVISSLIAAAREQAAV